MNVNLFSDKSEEARLYYKIFSDMGRQGELYNYYHRTHKTNSQKQFNTLRTSGSVDTWLHGFYSSILELFHAQVSLDHMLSPSLVQFQSSRSFSL